MRGPLEIRAAKADNRVASPLSLAAWIVTPVTVPAAIGVFAVYSPIILNPLWYVNRTGLFFLMGLEYNLDMSRRKKLPEDIRAFFVRMGSEGGRIGSQRRMEKLTPEQRREIARNAIAARWANRSRSANESR